MSGLATVQVESTGRLVVYRPHAERDGNTWVQSWKTASATLPPEAVAAVLEAVEANRLGELDRAYHANVHDGTQWVLWLRQDDREKAVYFDNHFPESVVRFARWLDEIIVGSVEANMRWRWVPSGHDRDHDADLWDAIKH